VTASRSVHVASASVGSTRSAISSLTLLLEEERLAEIATEHAADPDHELLHDRTVQPELRSNGGHVLRGGVVARDDGRRIAGGERRSRKTTTATTVMTGSVARRRRPM